MLGKLQQSGNPATLARMAMCFDVEEPLEGVRFRGLVAARRRRLEGLAGIQALSAGLTVAQAVVLADVIVAIFLRGDDVATRLLLLAGVGCCRALLAAVQELVAGRVSTRVRTELRAIGLHAVRQLGPGWAQQQPAGRLV